MNSETLVIIYSVLSVCLSRFSFFAGALFSIFGMLNIYMGSHLMFILPANGSPQIVMTIILSFANGFIFANYGSCVMWLNPSSRDLLKVNRYQTISDAFHTSVPILYRVKAVFAWIVGIIYMLVRGVSNYTLLCLLGILLFHIYLELATIFGYIRRSMKEFDMELIPFIILFLSSLILIVFVLTNLAMKLRQFSRFLSRSSFEDTVNSDSRAPILFLRSFRNDQVKLPHSRISQRYWQALPEPQRLDHQLVEEFGHLGPIIALGRPGEKQLPYGAARIYVIVSEFQS